MSTKFFTNTSGDTLFDKFRGLAERNPDTFRLFDAVTGYFRASGYFKLRKVLAPVKRIRVLVGINYDDLFLKHDKGEFFIVRQGEAAEIYKKQFIQDVKEANYTPEVEDGIFQLMEDIRSERVELRVHSSKNLHAKFYLCLPEDYNKDALTGLVIMGSSNLTDAGLGTDTRALRYELNVEMRDYDDVAFCIEEFEKLWKDGLPLTYEVLEDARKRTYLGMEPTPYELYMKLLIESFQEFVEDTYDFRLPPGVLDLQYQRDAALQGYQILRKTHGFYLADVVGLGKTLVAMLVIQRFIFENGANTQVLVVTTPATQAQWKQTAMDFKIKGRQITFVNNGSLHHVLDGSLCDCAEVDLVVVDEAHGFRATGTTKFEELQTICKTRRTVPGRIPDKRKFVMLLSATPLNNRPSDLRAQVELFQDTHACTLNNIPDLEEYFAGLESEYKKRVAKDGDLSPEDQKAIEHIYNRIRTELLSQIMVRRTRTNIVKDERYAKDLKAQGVVFPQVEDPRKENYLLEDDYAALFAQTVKQLREQLHYARYRAVEFLKERSELDVQRSHAFSTIFRMQMVKRIESSILAFRKSLKNLIKNTEQMCKMFRDGKVVIAPEYDVKDAIDRHDGDVDAALQELEKKFSEFRAEDHCYKPDDFRPEFVKMLERDRETLIAIQRAWTEITECCADPKFECFLRHLTENDWLSDDYSNEGKLVVFSEAADTARYLCEAVADSNPELGKRCLFVEAKTFQRLKGQIQSNFDANIPGSEQQNEYSILFTTDALAEGINLHRANTIVHYDTPWNATRLMQRIGRVNRIGSKRGIVHNIVFYPSEQGNKELNLCRNTFAKLAGFHAALGEDARVFTDEEVLYDFRMFQSNPEKDDEDERLELLREVQALYETDVGHYRRIKSLPDKSRTFRDVSYSAEMTRTLVFLKAGERLDYYAVKEDDTLEPLSFVRAAKAFKAHIAERPSCINAEEMRRHMADVMKARINQQDLLSKAVSVSAGAAKLTVARGSVGSKKALTVLRCWGQRLNSAVYPNTVARIKDLQSLVAAGRLGALANELVRHSRSGKHGQDIDAIVKEVDRLWQKFKGTVAPTVECTGLGHASERASIVLSETFVKGLNPGE